MADETLTPLRALTVALTAAMLDAESLQARAGLDRVSTALLAADTAGRAIGQLPGGWEIVDTGAADRREHDILEQLRDVEHRLREIDATYRLLLGIRILDDGHAKTLGEAVRIARDLEKVREIYPGVEGVEP